MTLEIHDWKSWFDQHRKEIFADFFHFLRFKTIATDSVYHDECSKCAHWLKDYLQSAGFTTTLWETPGMPVVFATHCEAGKDRPTLLIYQHYDVQPVDPLELWKSPPFEPTIRDGEIYARGAVDNKGQCFYSISALKALLKLVKKLNFNIKLFIEGEEESGSLGTDKILDKHAAELKADYLLIVDTGIPNPYTPAVTLSARGIVTMEIHCQGSSGDLHSGLMGGVAYNPLRALVHALSKLWTPEGKVAIPHFYDGVEPLSKSDLSKIHLEMPEEEVTRQFGLAAFCPEPGFTIGQSATIRPTVEINGLCGGYTGEGFKTVIPAQALVKLSCRLVPNQKSAEIITELQNFLQKQMPKGMKLEFKDVHASPAFRSRLDSEIAKLVAKAYEDVMEKPCQYRLGSGSIPIVTHLSTVSGAETVLMGYGLDTDQVHAPNEHFGLDRFERGFLTMGRILSRLNGHN